MRVVYVRLPQGYSPSNWLQQAIGGQRFFDINEHSFSTESTDIIEAFRRFLRTEPIEGNHIGVSLAHRFGQCVNSRSSN